MEILKEMINRLEEKNSRIAHENIKLKGSFRTFKSRLVAMEESNKELEK